MIPKFRYFNKLTKEMVTSDFVVSSQGRVIDTYNNNGWVDMGDTAILMQSTGLFDKNGKEIFEGDVVTYNSSKSNYIVSFGQFICYFSAYNKRGENILRLAPGYGWYLKHFRDSFWNVSGEVMDEPANIEVLGNIHEHPDLVEVGR